MKKRIGIIHFWCAAVALSTITLLSGCGGGGASNPYAAVPALVVNPSAVSVYSGTAAVLTISSGVGPFQVFTSDANILPVTQAVNGASISLLASAVDVPHAVTLTVQDAASQRVTVTVTVNPSPLLSAISIVPLTNTRCGEASGTQLAPVCSGETAAAQITLKANGVSFASGRTVRFEVLQGAYNFATDQSASVLAKSTTTLTDQNGLASVILKADNGTYSQTALMRVTDLTTGNHVDGAFSIVQQIDGSAVLSVVPGSYTTASRYKNECVASAGDFLVYGGRAPYTVRSSLPNSVKLSVNGVTGDPVTVTLAGQSFRASTDYSDACLGYSAVITITDASSRTATVTYTNNQGSEERPTSSISPASVALTANTLVNGNCGGRSVVFVASGGKAPYQFSSSLGASSLGAMTTTTAVPITSTVTLTLPSTVLSGDVMTVSLVDAAGKLSAATVSCVKPAS